MEQGLTFEGTLEVQPKREVGVDELDKALIACRDAESAYDDAHALSAAAYKVCEEKEQKLIDLMVEAGKDRWEFTGVKGYSLRDVFKFRVPNSPDNKATFFGFLKSPELSSLLQQRSEDIFLTYATVNHNSLNSLMNKVTEEAAEKGIILPETGIDQPIAEKKLVSLRGKK